ncbi:MAG TPA: AraC family transcriptional regulator [Allosphingosinicella sp.]|jgi:AraC-like DNA-binding protein
MPQSNPAEQVPQVRAVALTHYVAVARSVGLDGFEMLRGVGIDPGLLEDAETRIPASAASRLLTQSALRSGCESFALRLAELRSFASLGPLSLLLRHERNLRAVLRRMIAYRGLMTQALDFELVDEDEETRIVLTFIPEVERQGVELGMALTCRFLGGAIFGGWHPAEVHFQYSEPADARVHQRIFRAPLVFNARFNGFVIPTASLDRENASADPEFVEHARSYVDLLARDLPTTSLADQAGAAIRGLLPAGGVTLPKVAGQLAIHPRALQRKLSAAGLRFAGLVETIRGNVARDLLANTDLAVTEVALLAGYASAAAFSRWFAASAGEPPRTWRLRNRPGAEGSGA